MTDSVESALPEVANREKSPLPPNNAKNLKVVERSTGKYTLWEVPKNHQYTAGTNFPHDDYLGETRNRAIKGTLGEIVGGSPHIYLFAEEAADHPSMCFVSDTPIENVSRIKEELAKAVQTNNGVPFIRDKDTGLLIVPISYTAKRSIGEEMHVGPRSGTHRDLLIFPLLIRDLVGKQAILTESDYDVYKGQLKYGDILQTGEGNLFTTLLAKDYSPEEYVLLSSLGLVTYDNLPVPQNEPAMKQLYDVFKVPLELKKPADLLKRYLERDSRLLSIYNLDNFNSYRNLVGFTPGLYDAESLHENGEQMDINDPSKTEILEAVADGYDSEKGLESKAMVLYRHPRYPDRYLLAIGGSHPEVQMFVKKLAEDNKRFNYSYSLGEYQPIEIAQLAGTVFFDKPEELSKEGFTKQSRPKKLGMRVVLDKLQNTPQYKVNKEEVLKALETMKDSKYTPLKLTLTDSLEEQLKLPPEPPQTPATEKQMQFLPIKKSTFKYFKKY